MKEQQALTEGMLTKTKVLFIQLWFTLYLLKMTDFPPFLYMKME